MSIGMIYIDVTAARAHNDVTLARLIDAAHPCYVVVRQRHNVKGVTRLTDAVDAIGYGSHPKQTVMVLIELLIFLDACFCGHL